jgi:hypothetical protein
MLNQMSLLSVGPDLAPAAVRSIYLQYLNLAHFELYNYSALMNDDVMVMEALTTTFNAQPVTQTITLSQVPLSVSQVYYPLARRFLAKKGLEDFMIFQSGYSYSASPQVYNVAKQTISIYPFVSTDTYALNCLYVPQPMNLIENMNESDIPYPLAYHGYLVDGALYYLFQDEEGFQSTSKGIQHQQKWEKGKTALFSYLINSSNKEIRTFSNV